LPIEKATDRIAIGTAIIGLLLFIPFGSFRNLLYPYILAVHIIFGIILGVLLVRLMYRHVPIELSNPFKPVVKKWNGFKLLLYLMLAILSGIIFQIVYIKWLGYFHGFIGLWILLVGWKHRR
jgi:multisubunit Na+/H+ antiporter MnhE subunit